jgi:putative DNA methylase
VSRSPAAKRTALVCRFSGQTRPRSLPRPGVDLCSVEGRTLLETRLPFRELSLLVSADRRRPDPAYGAHRWWARRPPSAIRGLLLALALPGSATQRRFWKLFSSGSPSLAGFKAHDVFVGGGTTLVEASRLGATVSGTDVDPLAVAIVRHELERPDAGAVRKAGSGLLAHLRESLGNLYGSTDSGWQPLHYFYLHRVTCPSCATQSLLYRSRVLARFIGSPGGVVRDSAIIAFCDACLTVHSLESPQRRTLTCCGRRRRLADGTFGDHRFTCPHCDTRSTHSDLLTGACPLVLVAVEETSLDGTRRIRGTTITDQARLDESSAFLAECAPQLPTTRFRTRRLDPRPVSYGMLRITDLFTARQLIVFGKAFEWLRSDKVPKPVSRALGLAISNALTTNNRLCGYATDYGRLAPLFSVRGFSLPALAVELNPLHDAAGRGTIQRAIERVARTSDSTVSRSVWSMKKRRPAVVSMSFGGPTSSKEVRCRSAASSGSLRRDADICLFDPPYFDYIAYDELSEFYRAWLNITRLGGRPLLPRGDEPTRSFGEEFGRCLKRAVRHIRPGRPLAFTFHSTSPAAWEAIGIGVDSAKLVVTGIWPIRTDPHMGHHSDPGNCEWDLVVVCRPARDCTPVRRRRTVRRWLCDVKPLKIGTADRVSMGLALQMCRLRWGTLSPV